MVWLSPSLQSSFFCQQTGSSGDEVGPWQSSEAPIAEDMCKASCLYRMSPSFYHFKRRGEKISEVQKAGRLLSWWTLVSPWPAGHLQLLMDRAFQKHLTAVGLGMDQPWLYLKATSPGPYLYAV